jgi:hypothetical protein
MEKLLEKAENKETLTPVEAKEILRKAIEFFLSSVKQ